MNTEQLVPKFAVAMDVELSTSYPYMITGYVNLQYAEEYDRRGSIRGDLDNYISNNIIKSI